MHPQPLADQSRVEPSRTPWAQDEGAGTGDVDMDLLVVGGLAERQLFQRQSSSWSMRLALRALPRPTISSTKPRQCRQRLEVARGAQARGRLRAYFLEMAVGTLDRTVLVEADARIVAGQRHAVIGAERLVARVVRSSFASAFKLRKAAGRGCRCVESSFGNAAERPQRVLQPFGQRDEAFAAEYDMSVFEARERQAEVIEPAVEVLAGDGGLRRDRPLR